MIDLAALTQARKCVTAWERGESPKAEWMNTLMDLGVLVTRLWQPCQTCDGDGRWAQCHEYHGPCLSCGGAGVEPTPQAVEVFLREASAYVAMHGGNIGGAATRAGLMGLWNLIDKELVG